MRECPAVVGWVFLLLVMFLGCCLILVRRVHGAHWVPLLGIASRDEILSLGQS